MSGKFTKGIILAFSILVCVNSMTISTRDSIIYHSESEPIQLSNNFIFESTLRIQHNDSLVKPNKIYPIDGILFLKGVPENSLLVIEYEFLNKNIPLIIGPKWKQLPALDRVSKTKEIKKNLS